MDQLVDPRHQKDDGDEQAADEDGDHGHGGILLRSCPVRLSSQDAQGARRFRPSAPRQGEAFDRAVAACDRAQDQRSEEHTSELQSLMRISYAVFCLKKKTEHTQMTTN